jgi:hypothetical protein
MFLRTRWERFARAQHMEVGCLLNFKYEGDGELRVKVTDGTHAAAGTTTTATPTMARMAKFKFSDILPLQQRW